MSKRREVELHSVSKPSQLQESIAYLISAVPYLGGPISGFVVGKLTQRKFDRFNGFLQSLADELREFRSEAAEKYVNSEEFEELFEKTVSKVTGERSAAKRKAFSKLLTESIRSSNTDYDEQLDYLRIMDELQEQHFEVMRAISQTPDPNPPGISGTIEQTLLRRLPNLTASRVQELLARLQDLRLTRLSNSRTMMTAHGAEDLRHGFTELGKRLVRFILEE